MTAPTAPRIRSRKPTGTVPWPCLLIEGEEKVGKSYAAALLSRSERVGDMYWIDLGEGAADEYGAIPGVDYNVIEHDGTYKDILGQIRAVKAEAARVFEAKEPPVVLVIDSISDLWDGLKVWVDGRARERQAKKGRKVDVDEEVRITQDLWNDATARWRKVTRELLTFPGVVVMLARGKEVSAMDSSGRPIEGKKDYRVEGQKTIGHDATMWVRLRRASPPMVIGARSVYGGIRPGIDEPQPIIAPEASEALIEWLVFSALRCDPHTAHVRDLRYTTVDDTTAYEAGGSLTTQLTQAVAQLEQSAPATPPDAEVVARLAAEIAAVADIPGLKALWDGLGAREKAGELTGAGAVHIRGLVAQRKAELGPVDEKTLQRLHILLGERHIDDRDDKILVVSRLAGRVVESSKHLTRAEALAVIAGVEQAGPDVDLLSGRTIPPGAGVVLNADGVPIDAAGNEIDDLAANEQDAADEWDGDQS